MSAVLEIIKPGIQSSIQGSYRYGYFGQGIPPSGPMDEFSHHMGNVLLRNAPDAASIEFTMMGGTLRFLKDTVFALTGAVFSSKLNGAVVENWRTYRASRGDVLTMGYVKNGCRAYLAVAGGFSVPLALGSTSTYVPGAIGGHRGRYLIAGDELNDECTGELSCLEGRSFVQGAALFPGNERTVYITEGPQYDHYTEDSIREFFETEWMVTDKINRTGLRLKGVTLRFRDRVKDPDESKHMSNIIDDGIPIGGMQTPNGEEIICMARDCVSAGGYTKIGVVIRTALDVMGQLPPHEKIRFQLVSLEEAVALQQKRVSHYTEESVTTTV